MNRGEVEAFKRRARDLQDRYRHVLSTLERDEAIKTGEDASTFVGEGINLALEMHVRLYLLDPLLEELGWEVQVPAKIVVEDGVQPIPTDAGGHRRRLDYHGRDAEGRRSLLAVEAKRPSAGLPDTGGRPIGEWITHGLRLINTGDPKAQGLPAGWKEILDTAIDYVRRVQTAYGDEPLRFMLTNGDWFVVFSELRTSLLAREPVVKGIRVFSDLTDVITNADEFCGLLGYQNLSGHIPAQRPGALPEFVPDGEEAICARFVDVSYVRHGERQPAISLRAGAWIRTPKGVWILFQKSYATQFLLLSDEPEELAARRQKVVDRAESLLADLRNYRQLRFATLDEYCPQNQGSGESHEVGHSRALVVDLGRGEQGDDRYRVITLHEPLYFNEHTGYDSCRYHSWGLCDDEGSAEGAAIVAPSSDPRCFFPSGSEFHCSHSSIQARRATVCLIQPFEERLCCQRCVFTLRCWEGRWMPCRKD